MRLRLTAPQVLFTTLILTAVVGFGVTLAGRSRPQRHTAGTRQIQNTSQVGLLVVTDESSASTVSSIPAKSPYQFLDGSSQAMRPALETKFLSHICVRERPMVCVSCERPRRLFQKLCY